MICNWPDAHPDELFYSICARYSKRVQYLNNRSIVEELFGTGNAIACVSLPSHLNYFIAQLPQYHIIEGHHILDDHSLLPFFAPFLPQERHSHLRQDMLGDNGSGVHMRAGLMASRVPLPQWLRFCTQCVEEDRRKYGECYWHRIHQVPGVEICPLHKTWVRNSSARARNVQTRYEFISAESAIEVTLPEPEQSDKNKQFFEILFALALDVQWLMDQRNLSQDLHLLQQRYLRRLVDLGISTYRGRVDRKMLLSRFKQMFDTDLLNLLHCELDEITEDCWLIRLIHKPDNSQHPLHHLLFIHSLGQTAEAFFRSPIQSKPFGDPPWPCLNPACAHYLEPTIQENTVTYSSHVSGKPIGTFSCECGFTYSRTGPDTSAEDQWKHGRIYAYGPVWESKLRKLWIDETLSLRAIARELGVDPLTIKRHAARIKLAFPRPVRKSLPVKETLQLHSHRKRTPEKEKIQNKRAEWIAAMQKYPEIGIMALRSKVPGLYTWLYRNDLIWFKEHRPLLFERKQQRKSSVDWSSRDQKLVGLVETSAVRLKNVTGRPTRITLSAIGRDIDQLSLLQQHLGKLPATRRRLETLVETREAFAVRRLKWATEQYRREGILPKRYELVRRAGVWRIASEDKVKLFIEEMIQALQSSHKLAEAFLIVDIESVVL